jgi:23S rRNA pseudouridine1911/1915/1917 synthase
VKHRDPMSKAALPILFEDDHFVAINKPAGLAVIPGRDESTSAIELLGKQLGMAYSGTVDPRIRVVHRIDKETSGVVLFARNKEAQRHVSEQFQNNQVEKEYLALVVGKMGDERGEIDAPLAVHPASKKHMAVSKHGRPARTLWQVERRFKRYTLLRVFPKTGKTHQIRVHLMSIGHPLAIDLLYNAPRGGDPGLYLSSFKRDYRPGHGKEYALIERLTLHAEKLRFVDMRGEKVEVVAPVPKDFRATVNQLGRHGG